MLETLSKKTVKAQKTREIILKSALELFGEKGYHRTSMRDIAKQAGRNRVVATKKR